MNICIFTGRTTKDIELKTAQSGNAWAKFTLAVETGFKETKKTHFFDMTVFGKVAEAMAQFVIKGTKIAVECEAQQNKYTDRNGNNVSAVNFMVHSWEFAQSKGENQQINQASTPQATTANNNASASDNDWMNVPDDLNELPFN